MRKYFKKYWYIDTNVTQMTTNWGYGYGSNMKTSSRSVVKGLDRRPQTRKRTGRGDREGTDVHVTNRKTHRAKKRVFEWFHFLLSTLKSDRSSGLGLTQSHFFRPELHHCCCWGPLSKTEPKLGLLLGVINLPACQSAELRGKSFSRCRLSAWQQLVETWPACVCN